MGENEEDANGVMIKNTLSETERSIGEIETLKSRVVYENKWMKVREDHIRRPSGAEGIYGVVDKPDFVAIVPIDNNHIHLVQQYRYPVQQRYWEIPQGSWESNSEVDHAEVAAGELREETGLTAKKLDYVGHIYQAYGYSNQGFRVYLATDFEFGTQKLDIEEEGLITKAFSLDEFDNMIIAGRIKDATTLSAYSLIKMKILSR